MTCWGTASECYHLITVKNFPGDEAGGRQNKDSLFQLRQWYSDAKAQDQLNIFFLILELNYKYSL